MAIQMRRGIYDKFDPTRLVAGEWAVVLSNDPAAKDGRAAYVCFASGIVKRIATYEDLVDYLMESADEVIAYIYETACSEAIETYDDLVKALQALQTNMSTAENTRVSNEQARASAEAIRESNESARQTYIAGVRADVAAGVFDGATFTPSVDENGVLSWKNDKGKTNPTSVNIKGERGNDGIVTTLETGMYAFEIIDGDLCFTYYEGNDVPDFYINDDGDLCVNIEGS